MKNKKTSTICAIICEFNPMHTGHLYLINKAKEITNCDYVLGLMSGNFSQRSEACILDKYTRGKIATENGLDLVLNYPAAFCTNNAEVFALSAIKILNQTGVNYLAFGAEFDNEKSFFDLANFMLNEPTEFKEKLKANLKTGIAYFNAYTKTIKECSSILNSCDIQNFLNILTKPNNTLALEYIKALIKTKSKIKPILIHRIDNYNEEKETKDFVSANFLRKKIIENSLFLIKKYLPKNSLKYFENNQIYQNIFDVKKSISNTKISGITEKEIYEKKFNLPLILKNLILYKIKSMSLQNLKQIYSVDEGLEYKLKNEASANNSFDDFYSSLQTKRYKQNKINSVLLNSLLNIDKKTIEKIYTTKTHIYVKILSINPKKHEILSKINTKYLISRKTDAINLHFNKFNKKLFEIENNANIVYNLAFKTSLNENDLYNKMH